jgi:hypothetical protein
MSLYKYVVPDRVDIFKNKVIRFTQPNALNDPFEMQPYFEWVAGENFFLERCDLTQIIEYSLRETYAELPTKHRASQSFEEFRRFIYAQPQKLQSTIRSAINQALEQAKAFSPPVRESFSKMINRDVGILCLTGKCDNHLMWSHYAQNHQGFVIEFDESHKYFHQQKSFDEWELFGYLKKVEYRTERPQSIELVDMSLVDVFWVKGKEWEYEEEWRMLRHLRDAGTTIESAAGNIYLFPIEPSCIRSVIFGCQMSQDKKLELMEILSRDECYSHVKRYQAVRKERDYGLEIIQSEI